MDILKIETFAPCFPGFYETKFDIDFSIGDDIIRDIEESREELELDEFNFDDLSIDYKSYMIQVAKLHCIKLNEVLVRDLGIDGIISINFQNVHSPRYYNFSNDSINIELVLDESSQNKIIQLINDNYDQVRDEIKGRYTACDGYIPYYSNDINDWLNICDSNYIFESKHTSGAILDILIGIIVGVEEVTESTFESVRELNYLDFVTSHTYEELYELPYSSTDEKILYNQYMKIKRTEAELWMETQNKPLPKQLDYFEWVDKYCN